MEAVSFILYVKNQEESMEFYSHVLSREPVLHVPGMTEFELGEACTLGLMPETGIRKLLGKTLPDPAAASGVPRSEIYLLTKDATELHERSLQNGARELSPLKERDWGHRVAYSLDPDGHVLAFAELIEE